MPRPDNEYSNPEQNSAGFLKRFGIYLAERFNPIGYGVIVSAFSFSAISYSRICRGVSGFVLAKIYFAGIFITITLFLLVRIFDEFKDAEDDAAYRKELPVPRGLVSLRELGIVGIIVAVLQVVVNLLVFPKMLVIYLLIIGYLSLMGKEFFVPQWLKKHQFWYVVSHMLIIPLADVYASGLDWYLNGVAAPRGLLFFFAVSYMNGVLLEIGRKIRTPLDESPGVLTYSSMLGAGRALMLYFSVFITTLTLCVAAGIFAGYGAITFIWLGAMFILCMSPAVLFAAHNTTQRANFIQLAANVWAVAMYLVLGGGPMISKLWFHG